MRLFLQILKDLFQPQDSWFLSRKIGVGFQQSGTFVYVYLGLALLECPLGVFRGAQTDPYNHPHAHPGPHQLGFLFVIIFKPEGGFSKAAFSNSKQEHFVSRPDECFSAWAFLSGGFLPSSPAVFGVLRAQCWCLGFHLHCRPVWPLRLVIMWGVGNREKPRDMSLPVSHR